MLLPKDYTFQEKKIANCLSNLGLRYTEQFNILQYTVDFWVSELNIVIEADGQMGHLRKADAKRDADILAGQDTEVSQVAHITSTDIYAIMEELCLVLDKL